MTERGYGVSASPGVGHGHVDVRASVRRRPREHSRRHGAGRSSGLPRGTAPATISVIPISTTRHGPACPGATRGRPRQPAAPAIRRNVRIVAEAAATATALVAPFALLARRRGTPLSTSPATRRSEMRSDRAELRADLTDELVSQTHALHVSHMITVITLVGPTVRGKEPKRADRPGSHRPVGHQAITSSD